MDASTAGALLERTGATQLASRQHQRPAGAPPLLDRRCKASSQSVSPWTLESGRFRMVRDPMNTPVHAVRHMRHGLPSAYTRRKLTERREGYATQKKSGRVVLEVSFPPLERGPSVPVPQDLLSSCDRGSLQDHESAHATRGACSALFICRSLDSSAASRVPEPLATPRSSC